MPVLDTDRLALHRFTLDDAPFVLRLLNEPSFLRFIGDKGVRTLDDARGYLSDGPIASYERHEFGLFRTELSDTGASIGMCGLLKRDALADVDIGFAFLPEYWRRGYAFEAAAAALAHGYETLELGRIVAVTSSDNAASAALLEKLGLRFEREVRLADGADPCRMFAPVAGVVLRDVASSDIATFFAQQLDAKANDMAAFTRADPTDENAFRSHWRRLLADADVRVRAVLHDGHVAGHVGSFVRDGSLEVTYWLGRGFWGRGIATSALALFLEQTARPVFARVARDNRGSLRVLEKCGFSIVGSERGFARARDADIDELVLVLNEKV